MSVTIQQVNSFPVTIGTITLYLSAYQVSGGCQLREQGTADGTSAVASFWSKGAQISLSGQLAQNPENAILALDALARSHVGISFQIGDVSCQNAVLVQYSVQNDSDAISVSLTFYCPSALVPVVSSS
ncbi:MAG TPA: hypothetical protein DCO72_02660 [Ruminococcus sp.]|nr:hypothetical protein [Ruminococcus sp.]